jgi:hypothetical protein
VSAFRINLNNIEGTGDFPCPSCGAIISPDDDSEKTYKIVNIETYEDGSLKFLTLLCKKCRATIILEGFEALNSLEGTR